jgi:membrane protease YdiL (CAAX protease family)
VAPRGPSRGGALRPARPRAARLLSQPSVAPGGPEPRWGLGDVAVGLIPFALVGLTLLAADGDDVEAEITIGALVANSVILWVFLIGVPVVATRRKGRGPVADLDLRVAPVDALAFVLGIFVQAVAIPLLYWPLLRFTDLSTDDVSDDARELVDAASGAGIVVLVLVVCVGAPFAEELFFRGLLLRAVDKRWGILAAVVGSTLVFAVTHFQGVQFPALVLFGLVAAVLVVRTGRLGTAIACHAGFNAWTVFNLLVLDS